MSKKRGLIVYTDRLLIQGMKTAIVDFMQNCLLKVLEVVLLVTSLQQCVKLVLFYFAKTLFADRRAEVSDKWNLFQINGAYLASMATVHALNTTIRG